MFRIQTMWSQRWWPVAPVAKVNPMQISECIYQRKILGKPRFDQHAATTNSLHIYYIFYFLPGIWRALFQINLICLVKGMRHFIFWWIYLLLILVEGNDCNSNLLPWENLWWGYGILFDSFTCTKKGSHLWDYLPNNSNSSKSLLTDYWSEYSCSSGFSPPCTPSPHSTLTLNTLELWKWTH